MIKERIKTNISGIEIRLAPKYSEKNLCECHRFYHKWKVDWSGIETGSQISRLCHVTTGILLKWTVDLEFYGVIWIQLL